MVLTRAQRAKLYSGEGNGGTAHNTSDDSEISFGPTWLDRHLLRRRPRAASTTSGESEQQMADQDDRQERRLQLLESAVMGMTEKFDNILSSFNPVNSRVNIDSHQAHGGGGTERGIPTYGQLPAQPAHHNGGPSQQPSHGHHLHQPTYHASRPVPVNPRAPPYADFVADQLRHEEFVLPRHEDGKAMYPDLYLQKLNPKPYMYLDRPGVETVKKKLELRNTMTYSEYMVAVIKLIRDPRHDQNEIPRDTLLEHVQQIVEDSTSRDWSTVRRWSQATFDAVERGDYSWQDRQHIQIQRIHHALLATRPSTH